MVVAQAIGEFADFIGLFMAAMWRMDAIPIMRRNWPLIARIGSIYPWTTCKRGERIRLES
ncbi:MAG: hypothetical protein HY895_19120 [Deltaproteobacteria bacterium]|nr:hypothetical protein [Deltaproteobacteria bacterium]